MNLLLARHGETDWNARGWIQGQTDTPLNETGRGQANALGQRLLREGIVLSAIYSSPQCRALETAQIAGRCLNLVPVVVEDLREISFGAWEGHTWEEIAAGWPEHYAAYDADRMNVRPPEGESYRDLLQRVIPALYRLAHSGAGTALVVVHSAVIRGVICGLGDKGVGIQMDYHPDNGDWVLCPELPESF